jgi:predicted ester cyclase
MMDLAAFFEDVLRDEGFQPERTKHGSISFKFEGGRYYMLLDDNDPDYFYLLYPGFWEVDVDGYAEALRIANELTREKKAVKIYLSADGAYVSASVEQFVAGLENVRGTFMCSLRALQAAGREFTAQMRRSAEERAREVHKRLVQQRIAAAFDAAGHVDLALILTEGYTNDDPARPPDGWPPGPEGYHAYGAMYRGAFADLTPTVAYQVAEGDSVATYWTAQGTHVGPFMGYSPSQQRVTLRAISIDRLESERIAETLTILDLADLQRQLDPGSSQHQEEG